MGLTKQERVAKKIAAGLEKKRVAAEAKKQRRRDELQREVDSHLLWQNQVQENWRDAMMKVKMPIYRQQIEVMWHTLDRFYDKKDSLIGHLVYLRDIANFQYQRTLGGFSVTASKIISNFLNDLEDMCKRNDAAIANLVKFGQDELSRYLEDHKKAETHLRLMMYINHEAADALAWNTRGNNVVRRDEDASAYNEIHDSLSAILEGQYCWIWEEYKTTLRGYVKKTCEDQKQLRLQRKKVKAMDDLVAVQGKKLIFNQKSINRLRIEHTEYESGEKQAGFRDRRNRLRNANKQLKENMNRGVEKDTEQLSILVKASDEAVDWIEGAKKKCDKILRLAAQCRKYETRHEKTMPYGSEIPQESVKTHLRMHPDEDPMIFNALAPTSGLARLCHRISKAELSKKALIREKMLLERENALLESKLHEKNKENIEVSPVALKCTCEKPARKVQGRSENPPYAIEGALEIKKYFVR